ncbi:protein CHLORORESPIRATORY REDUCTION 42, chloroplastic [Rhodamnia argentea]|uniref:Protein CHLORORESPIRATORY REDUCTION 42, chloroplastic n=1 Tax=Rhodamnia argentea TaxID=178133 RepID=A0A8B8NIG1_9MYRT|nr:protein CHLORORESPIRATORY REDUCTION 42, chloroplastic [Rhodamnia argentea]
MAFSLSSTPSFPCSMPCTGPGRLNCLSLIVKCEADGSSVAARSKLEVGSPVIVTEAPTMIKTAASVPCLRVNSGLVKPGDVGRIVSRKPKDVWAVRLAIGTYLIDGKFFKPLELDD